MIIALLGCMLAGLLVAAVPAGAQAPAAAPASTTTSTPPADPPASVVDPESRPIPEGSGGPVSVGGDMGGTMLRLLLGLAVVVALIFGVWHVMKRVQRGRYPAAAEASGDLIGVLATTPLGPNRALHIVRVADEVVLVGATDHSVQAVAVLDVASAEAIARSLDDGGPGMAARARAMETSGGPQTLLERLRAMTTRD